MFDFQELPLRVTAAVSVVRPWLPRGARESLYLLRRPGLSQLERCLAASIVVGDLKLVLARWRVTETYLALVRAEIQRHVGDFVDADDLDVGDGN